MTRRRGRWPCHGRQGQRGATTHGQKTGDNKIRRNAMRKKLFAGMMLAGSLVLSGPGSARAAETFNTDAVLIYYDSSGNATLDPAEPQNGSSYSHETLLALYDTLIRFDQQGRLTPGLAESWQMNDDLTEL